MGGTFIVASIVFDELWRALFDVGDKSSEFRSAVVVGGLAVVTAVPFSSHKSASSCPSYGSDARHTGMANMHHLHEVSLHGDFHQ